MKVKAVTLHPAVIGWAVLFILFWVVMWVYVFGSDILGYRGKPWYAEVVSSYVATMFGGLGIISMGSVATWLTGNIVSSSAAVRYLTRYSRLTPRRLLLEDVSASLASILIVVAIVIAASILLSWQRYGVLVKPRHPLALAGLLALLGLYFYTLSLAMGYTVLATGSPRSMKAVASMLPLALSFIPYALLFTSYGNAAGYIYPPVGLQALIIAASSGKTPPATGILRWMYQTYVKGVEVEPVNPWLVLASTALWIALLALTTTILYRKARAVHPEELT